MFVGRNKALKKLRDSGENTLEMFTDSKGKSFLVNFQKKIAKGEGFVNKELNDEFFLRFQKFFNNSLINKEEVINNE